MSKLLFLIRKELLLISRDAHGLLLLFVMPALFILIMTFALQNQYSDINKVAFDFYLVNHDAGPNSTQLVTRLNSLQSLHLLQSSAGEEELYRRVAKDQASFLLVIGNDFDRKLGSEPVLQLFASPGTSGVTRQLVEAQIFQQALQLFASLKLEGLFPKNSAESDFTTDRFIQSVSTFGGDNEMPSSVQQNVPAWLLFAMFFIAIPLSTTVITERQQGTLTRLKTMGISQIAILSGKLVPYLLINLLQVVAMLLIGIYLIPLLGGENLGKNFSFSGLFLISLCASLAAVCYALLIAQLARTVEQATIISGVCNIIMAAIGGVMVPRFIMPAGLQSLGNISPMAWGLDGFHDIFLRNGNIQDVTGESTALVCFAALMLILSSLAGSRRKSSL